MKIKQEVIERIKGRSSEIKPKIMKEMNVTVQTVTFWINENKENGFLTCKAVLDIIAEVLNLTCKQILDKSNTPAPCHGQKSTTRMRMA